MVRHRVVAASVVTFGGVVAVIGTFLVWLRSGSNGRSSYEVFALVDRLGFEPDGLVGTVLRLWPLVPLVLVLSVIGQWVRPGRRAVRIVLIVLVAGSALFAGGTALAIANAPEISVFDVGPGPWTTVAGTALMLAGLVVPALVGATARVGRSTDHGASGRPAAPGDDPS